MPYFLTVGGEKVGKAADECLKKTLELAGRMLELADAGDAAREDVGCGVLYGVLRDSAYKLQRLAEAEQEAHLRKDGGEDQPPPESGRWRRAAKLTSDQGY